MHGVHLLDLDALNKWLASVEMRTSPDVNMHDLLPDKEAMCKLYAGFHQGMTSRVYVLVLSAFHHRVSFISPGVELARFSGNSWDPDAPLWARQLPMHKQLHFPQPLAFVAKLFAGMTDIPRGSVFVGEESVLQLWVRNGLAIAAPKALKRLDRRLVVPCALARYTVTRVMLLFFLCHYRRCPPSLVLSPPYPPLRSALLPTPAPLLPLHLRFVPTSLPQVLRDLWSMQGNPD
ncbi:hypothetical protein B0H14DRAFT_3489620 [Mycena olivaceomarginata]|nr:hypothetical protein B0H14DRAFT_3489620 [Mycena olivaceomarginata]